MGVFSSWIIVVLAIFSNAIASIMLKIFNDRDGRLSDFFSVQTIIYVGGALFLYFLAFILYMLMLKSIPFMKAYILLTFGVQVVLIFVGVFYFGERINFSGVMGMIFLMLGLFLVNYGISK